MDELIEQIHLAFAKVEYPGDTNLRNSNEGEEPFLLEKEFQGKDDWRALSAKFIDQAPDGFASALSFFSAEAFRFYLPAYLLADLAIQLNHADPLFHLTHGLTDSTKDVSINPRRYDNLTWFEYVSKRFSVFTVEETQAIIAYLSHKLDQDILDFERNQINQALANYWFDMAKKKSL